MGNVNYVTKNLTKGERILISPNLSGLVWFSVILVFLLGCAIPLFLFVAVWLFLKWHMTEYAITSKKVICKTGIFSVTTSEIRLAKVESVIIERNLLDMLCGCGTLVFNGTGNTKVKFEYVANPQKIKSEIDDALDDPEEYLKSMEEEASLEKEGEAKENGKKAVIWFGVFVICAILGGISEYFESKRVLSPDEIKARELQKSVWEEEAKQKEEKRLAEEKKKQEEKEKSYNVYKGEVLQSFVACSTAKDTKDLELLSARGDQNGAAFLLMNKCLIVEKGDKISFLSTKMFQDYIPIRVYLKEGQVRDLYVNILSINEKFD